MRYKVTNFLPPSEDGKELRIEVVYDTFEELVDKVIRDLNSFWKKMIPPNYTFNIKTVDSNTPLGMKYFVGGKLMGSNPKDVTGAIEVIGSETMKHWRKINNFAGVNSKDLSSEQTREQMKEIFGVFGDSK